MTKEILYEWNGLNSFFFKKINQTFGNEILDPIWIFIGFFAEYSNFSYIILLFCLYVLFILYRNKNNRKKTQTIIFNSTEMLASVGMSLLLLYFIVFYFAKNYFHFARPFVIFGLENIHVIKQIASLANPYKSFPSGHSALVSILASIAWFYLRSAGRKVCIFVVLCAAISRIAAGVHFPADVMGGIIIGVFIALFSHFFVSFLFNKYNKITFQIIVELDNKLAISSNWLEGKLNAIINNRKY